MKSKIRFAAFILALILTAFSVNAVMAKGEPGVPGNKPEATFGDPSGYFTDSSALYDVSIPYDSSAPGYDSSGIPGDEANVALHKPYTISVYDAFNKAVLGENLITFNNGCNDDERRLLTDGKVRSLDFLDAPGPGVPGTTVEFTGSAKDWTVTIDLCGSFDITNVILATVRRAANRYFNLVSVKTSTDGYTFTNAVFISNT